MILWINLLVSSSTGIVQGTQGLTFIELTCWVLKTNPIYTETSDKEWEEENSNEMESDLGAALGLWSKKPPPIRCYLSRDLNDKSVVGT